MAARRRGPGASFSVSVDHPRTRADTDYALTAARVLGTDHTFVPADGHYADYLLDQVAATGEPPNHVQSAYFGHLARVADRARRPRRPVRRRGGQPVRRRPGQPGPQRPRRQALVPLRPLRSVAAAASDLLGLERVAATFRLANGLYDFSGIEHPVNRVACFADLPAVAACFGRASILEAAADRRALLDRLDVPADPFDRLHAAGYLGEAADSASLVDHAVQRRRCRPALSVPRFAHAAPGAEPAA